MKIYLLVLLYLFTSLAFANIQDKPTVMLKLSGKNIKLNEESKLVLRMGVEEVLTEKGYLLISEENQNMALEQLSKDSKNECLKDSCLIDAGGMLAAKGVFSVEVVRIGKSHAFKVKYIDMETAAVLRTKSLMYKGKLKDGNALLPFSKKITREIFKFPTSKKVDQLLSKKTVNILTTKTEIKNEIKNEICNNISARACHKKGMKYWSGKKVRKDLSLAIKYFNKACENNDKLACNDLGYIHKSGISVSKNKDIAYRFYKKACTLGNKPSCKSSKLIKLRKNNTPKQIFKIGMKYQNKKQYKKANEMFFESCPAYYSGCEFLGYNYEFGKGYKTSKFMAKYYYQKGCKAKSGYSCNKLGAFHELGTSTKKNIYTARDFYVKSCNYNYGIGCYNLSSVYKHGKVGRRNSVKARKYKQKACKLGYKKACRR